MYMDQMKILTEQYAENGEWWVQNRNNPEAQDIARGYVEASLLDVAYNQFNKAYETMEPSDFWMLSIVSIVFEELLQKSIMMQCGTCLTL